MRKYIDDMTCRDTCEFLDTPNIWIHGCTYVCECDRSRDSFCSIVQNPAFVSGNLNSSYCQVTLAKFVIVSNHGHFMLGLRKAREYNRD